MEVKILKKDLMEGLQKTVKFIERTRNPKQNLNGILLKKQGNELLLYAGNSRSSICYNIPNCGGKDGEALVDGTLLTSYTVSFRDGDVHIKMEGKQLLLKCAGRQVKLNLLEKEAFPFIRDFNPDVSFCISGMILRNMVNDVAFSAGRNNTNVLVNSIECVVANEELTMTALDGHRIAWRKAKIKPTGIDANCIIEASILVKIVSLISDDVFDKELKFEISKTKFRLSVDKMTIIGSTVAGTYLNVSQILQPARNYSTRILLEKKRLESIVNACILASDESSVQRPMVLDIDKTVIISSKGSLSEVSEELTAQISGNKVRIGFNPGYVKECLQRYPADTIEVQFFGPRKPAKFCFDGYIIVICPVSIAS